MTKKESLQLFEEKKVRTVWDDKEEKWYFSIVDVCGVLTSRFPTRWSIRPTSPGTTALWRTT